MIGRWHREAAMAAFVVMEATAWFVALRAFGTGVERGAFRTLADDIQRDLSAHLERDPQRGQDALAVAARASEQAVGGASWPVVLLVALGAFVLVRSISRLRLPGVLAAAVGLAASLVALHVAVHLTLARDLWVWQGDGLAQLVDRGSSPFGGQIDNASFVANPDPARVERAASAVAVAGLFIVWMRFLIAGRGAVSYARVLRSFGLGFLGALIAAFFASAGSGYDVTGWVLTYFVLGVAALSVVHAARTAAASDALRREVPWLASVALTLAAIAAAAALFALLGALDAGRVFRPLADGLLLLTGRILMLLIAPFFIVIDWLLHFLIGDPPPFRERVAELGDQAVGRDRDGGLLFPGWVLDAIRAVLITLALWVAFRVSRLLFGRVRRGAGAQEYAELRSSGGGGGGLGLGGLLRRRRRSTGGTEWLRLHAVYALFVRVVRLASERGVERGAGQTPIE
ncbi:MAG: hypothetical protein FJ035_04025, partial [Chloroflexi bacterium]|nr:hypothetical protein [Chloroflexota bacterium]